MSWNQYVTTQLIATGAVCQGAILGKDTQLYAEEGGFALKQYKSKIVKDDGSEKEEDVNEAANLLAGITSGNFRHPQGIRLNGVKYQLLREGDGPTLYLKSPDGGACLSVTNTLVIIGIFSNESSSVGAYGLAACNKAVEDLAEYLRSNGY